MLNQERKEDIIYLIRYLQKLIDKDFDKRLSEYDLTGQQGRILFFTANKVREGIDVHQNDIENEFHLSKSTVSGLVKRMEKKKIITIDKQHPYAIIKPTDNGYSIICHLRKERQESVNKLIEGFKEEDKKRMCENIIKLIENMEGGKS